MSPGRRIPLRCSIGIAIAEPADTVESLIGNADQALYRAKQNGRNCIAWHAAGRSSARIAAVAPPGPGRSAPLGGL